MKRKHFRLGNLLLSMLWIGISLLSGFQLFMVSSSAYAFSYSRVAHFIGVTPTPTLPSGPSADSSLQFNGAIIAAIIGACALITAAIIAGVFAVYQMNKNHKMELKNREQQHQADLALERQRHEAELERMRYSDKLSAEREEQERERQHRVEANTAARAAASASAKAAMGKARTPAEREQAYREAVHADSNISQLQVLDMSQPLEVQKVYVRLRLHQETRLGYELEPELRSAEMKRDPNLLLKAGRAFLETRSSAAMTPEDALQKYRRCIVLGDPGAGKSTLLKYLTLKSVDKQLPNLPDLPIHIALGEFAASGKHDLIEFAVTRWNERYGFPEDEARTTIEEHLANVRAILLLDALDETVIGGSEEIASESYRHVFTAINQVATRFHKVPIVVTARKAGYHSRTHLNGFTELEVLDFRPEEIRQFIDNWFACYLTPRKYATADDLNTKLERNSRLQSLAANPLLLCLIVLVYEMHQDLPEKRAELYKQCTDTLLVRWDTSRDIQRRREFKTEYKRQLLTEIAWCFHRQGRRYFPEDELLKVIADFLETVNLPREQNSRILREIEEENGILKEQAHGWHGFLHLTLQEYFVAQYVGENDKLDELLRYRGDPWWEEVLSLYAGYTPDASPLLQKLLALEKKQLLWKDIFHTHLLWAGYCLAARPRIKQTSLREEVLARLFELLRRTPYSLTREQAIAILTEIGGNDVVARLLAVLRDKQDKDVVRWTVAEALGQLGEPGMVPDLLTVLKDKQDSDGVREDVASALGQLGGREVIPDLLTVLKDRQDTPNIRMLVADVLGQLGEPGVIPELLAVFKDKQDSDRVRGSVADALGQLGEPGIVPELLAVLKDKQNDFDVRGHVVQALGQLGEPGIVPELLAVLKDKQNKLILRGYVAVMLGQLGAPEMVPELLAVFKDKQDSSVVRQSVAEALGQLGEPGMVPYIIRSIKKNDDLNLRVRNILIELALDYTAIRAFARLLRKSGIADDVHEVLWSISQREKVRISMMDWKIIKLVRVRKW